MIGEDLSQDLSSTPQRSDRLLDRSLGVLVRVNWETVAWTLLLIVAVVSRFYDLGTRAMSHDESLHAYYSYNLYTEGTYQHNPMMHGTLLFHLNALAYALFGVTDATTRLMPALAGIGVVIMAWTFRRWIGRTGALLAGVLLAVSPSLLFHSRYIRNDIYIALFGMIWLYGMFRYVEGETRAGEDGGRDVRWLYVMMAGMAFGFTAKENQFMSGVIFGLFAVGAALWEVWRRNTPLKRSVFADLAVLMLTLVLPFASPVLYLMGEIALGWETVDWNAFTPTVALLVRFAVLVAIMALASAGIAYVWFGMYKEQDEGDRLNFGTWAAIMLAFWVIEIVLFTTFFTNPLRGLATGIVGSLGYWIAQQEVQRGSQPWYYYGILTLLYEFLPALLSLGGLTALVGLFFNKNWRPVDRRDLPVAVRAVDETWQLPPQLLRTLFVLFLAWWTIGAWGAYSYAGERMPWLLTHMVQPMALLGGWWLGRVIHRIDWRTAWETRAAWLIGLAPAAIFLLATLFAADPFGGRDLQSVGETVRFVVVLTLLGGLGYFAWEWGQRSGWSNAWRLMTLGVGTVLLLLTVRFSYMLTFVNYDMATEYLVYAHASPDIKRALAEIDLISERTVGDRQIRVAYDDDTAWPMSWYMRFYPNSLYYGANPNQDAMSAPVVIVGIENYAKVEPYLARDYVYRNYRLIWWPEESYKGLTLGQIWGALTDPARRERLWQIWFYRDHPDRSVTEWPHRDEFRLYIRKDVANLVWDLNVTPTDLADSTTTTFDYPEIDRTATAVYGGVYDDLPLTQPRAVAVGPNGARVIADSGNHRIVILDAQGNFVRAFGSLCTFTVPERTGCEDPDGSGPLNLGDGQLQEPWGVAVANDGTIYVADTWNGRIQLFDSEGNYLDQWGQPGTITAENQDPYALFGPRGITVAPNGDVLVADTGNHRIVRYTAEGDYVTQVGGGGVVLGAFNEPVDVAVDPTTGNVLVSDTWNQRIQVLSPDLEPLTEWPVPSWESRDIYDKPYVAVDSTGMVYASDPQFAQVFIYSSEGELQASFGKYGVDLNRFAKPNGLAIDPRTDQLLVADAANNRVMVFDNE